jgi:hypothetical protein
MLKAVNFVPAELNTSDYVIITAFKIYTWALNTLKHL